MARRPSSAKLPTVEIVQSEDEIERDGYAFAERDMYHFLIKRHHGGKFKRRHQEQQLHFNQDCTASLDIIVLLRDIASRKLHFYFNIFRWCALSMARTLPLKQENPFIHGNSECTHTIASEWRYGRDSFPQSDLDPFGEIRFLIVSSCTLPCSSGARVREGNIMQYPLREGLPLCELAHPSALPCCSDIQTKLGYRGRTLGQSSFP